MKKIVFSLVAAILMFGCATPVEKEIITKRVFYPPLPENPKLQYLTHISDENDIGVARGSFDEFLFGKKRALKYISTPYGITASKGKIYVTDREWNSIIIVDLEQRKLDNIETKGMGVLRQPAGIAISKDNFKYVADFGRKQIVVFDSENNYVRAYGQKDQFIKPTDVAVHENKLYVSDFGLNQVIVVDKKSGNTVQTIGEGGDDEGQFIKPTHVTLGIYDDIYVNDAFNFRIQMFDSFGAYVKKFGFHSDSFGGLARPKDIAVDRDGRLYVVDAAFENVQIFDDETLRLLTFFGGYGEEDGNMTLPSGIHIDYENLEYFKKYADKDFQIQYLIYVTNIIGDRKINVYGFGDWTGESLPADEEPR
jgi:DNA-binding beta-propeller fold protein YncE